MALSYFASSVLSIDKRVVGIEKTLMFHERMHEGFVNKDVYEVDKMLLNERYGNKR